MDKFVLAKQLFDQGNLEGSLKLLDEHIRIEQAGEPAFALRARIRFKYQDWGGAMNDFLKILELEPENKEAQSGVELTKNILGFYNPDMFNP